MMSQFSYKYNFIISTVRMKGKTSTQQIQFQLALVYDEISKMIEQKDELQIQMPSDVPTAIERINLIKSVVAYLLQQMKPSSDKNLSVNQSISNEPPLIECKECSTYEKNLQKIEGEVRNHIRTHQQLKLYQDGLEEKIEEQKKQKKEIEKKYESYKKKYDQMKVIANNSTEKASKLQLEVEKLKGEMKNGKQKYEDKRLNRYESNKENLTQWNHKNGKKERSSIEKRGESTERMRISVNVRSNKGIPITSKMVQEKGRDEKVKAIKSRIGFGY